MKKKEGRIVILLSFLICVLILVSSSFGLFVPDFYSEETPNWQAQSVGQDFINLAIVAPFLAITSVLSYNGVFYSSVLWAGSQLYLIYTYLIYCFSIHFNIFFIDYCLILGMSFYSLLYFFYTQLKKANTEVTNLKIPRIIAVYFILVASLFYFLWLSEIIPSIRSNSAPKNLQDAGLVTNPVHVLDLAAVLPGLIIIGILILRRHRLGYLLAPILLTFVALMDITICL